MWATREWLSWLFFAVLFEELSFLTGLALSKPNWATYSRENLIDFIETVVVTDKVWIILLSICPNRIRFWDIKLKHTVYYWWLLRTCNWLLTEAFWVSRWFSHFFGVFLHVKWLGASRFGLRLPSSSHRFLRGEGWEEGWCAVLSPEILRCELLRTTWL